MRKTLPFLFCIIAIAQAPIRLAAEFGPRSFEHPGFTAVVAAYRPEIEALLAIIEERPDAEIQEVLTFRGVQYHLGTFQERPILVFATGISIANAAMTMQMAFDYFPVTEMVYAGISGGVNPALRKGDVVIAERWFYHDETAYFNPAPEGGYVLADYYAASIASLQEAFAGDPNLPTFENFGMIFPSFVSVVKDGSETPLRMPYFTADAVLLEISRQALARLPEMPVAGADGTANVTVGGNAVTGSVFVDNAEYRNWLRRTFNAELTEMESAAVAQVCYINEIPWVIIRALSDLAGGQEGKNEENIYDSLASDNAARVLFAVLEELVAGE